MKRLYIAAALLILLLGVSLANGWYARKVTGEMCKELRQAQLLAEVEDWSQAESITRQVYEDWQSHHFYFHTLMRHSDTDQVLRAFSTGAGVPALQEPDQYNAANADLIAQLELLAEMEQVSVANVL